MRSALISRSATPARCPCCCNEDSWCVDMEEAVTSVTPQLFKKEASPPESPIVSQVASLCASMIGPINSYMRRWRHASIVPGAPRTEGTSLRTLSRRRTSRSYADCGGSDMLHSYIRNEFFTPELLMPYQYLKIPEITSSLSPLDAS